MAARKKLKAIGLTCGVGSMLIGARDAGFDVVGNIEWRGYYHHRDEEGRNTFEENFPGAFFEKDIATAPMLDDIGPIDLAFSHPECGNFSNMRIDKRSAIHDPGDIPLFVELVKKYKPRFFAMDDLPKSLIAYSAAKYVEELPEYDIFFEWVSNHGYGNIQKHRKRFFVIGALREEKFVFVPDEQEHEQTVETRLGDLYGREGEVPNHDKHNRRNICGKSLGFKVLDEKMSWSQLSKFMQGIRRGQNVPYYASDGTVKMRIGFARGYWDGPAFVLTGQNPTIHAKTGYPYSLRERARVQGTPDDFVFYGTKYEKDGTWDHERNNHMVKQTGKFMPVEFCRNFAQQVAAHIKGKPRKLPGTRLLAHNPYIDDAKRWYCENTGHADQARACGACWMYTRCEIRHHKYGIGVAIPQPDLEDFLRPADAPKKAAKEPKAKKRRQMRKHPALKPRRPPKYKGVISNV